MDGFQRRREQKKQAILLAALTLFMKNGIQKVSIAEIAKEAGVSQVTIYNYFESKHQLTYDVFVFYIESASSQFEELVHSDLPFPDKIRMIMFSKKEVAQQIHEEFYQYLMKQYSTEGNVFENLYEEKVVPYFSQLIQEGKDQGYVDDSLSEDAIRFYLEMLRTYMENEENYTKALPLTEDINKIFFYGIMKGKQE
ncbi:TetR/AcrR family transcriptional regulator [Rossellomorea marisflavi]|uniref:TetR family transcriptional regulator n=1 Tax=Rossellomorea marisflavi TaxID=189381 RepID=A0A163LRU5_9BACI|nr:TetR/AcrR family transcriptional regulator [Rossellomorea marisflavi]KMK94915.1 TetR family transcriptional regulator [Rossellomorea marisflavi]KZE50811.1 TetR family transcriptional regulator [Rossellomorea marisflavi]MCM2605651.1 TetR/AcrR family transcriptional regulator [Rossellomorea marisflavi]